MKNIVMLSILIISVNLFSQNLWTPLNSYPTFYQCINSIAKDEYDNLFCTTYETIYKSTDGGENWIILSENFPHLELTSFLIKDSLYFVGTLGGGVFRSSDKGISWQAINSGFNPLKRIFTIQKDETNNLLVGAEGGFFKSTNNGDTWNYITFGDFNVTAIAFNPITKSMYAGVCGGPSPGNGIYISKNFGATWSQSVIVTTDINSIFVTQNNNVCVTNTKYVFIKSTDDGLTWTQDINGLPNVKTTGFTTNVNDELLIGTYGYGIYRSINNGVSWFRVNSGLENLNITCLYNFNNVLYAGTGNGIYKSTSNGLSWNLISGNLVGKSKIFNFDNPAILLTTFGSGIYLSNDNGANWENPYFGFNPYKKIHKVIQNANGDFYLGAYGGGFRSTNKGIDWAYIGLGNADILDLAFNNEYLFVLASNGPRLDRGIYRSSDNGINWWNLVCPVVEDFVGFGLVKNGTIVVATKSMIYKSTDNGGNWSTTNNGLSNQKINCITSNDDSKIILGTNEGGIFVSDDLGNSWTPSNTGITDLTIKSISKYKNYVFAGSYKDGIFLSSNNGTTFNNISKGIPETYIYSISYDRNKYMYVTTDKGAYKSIQTFDLISDVNNQTDNYSFSLSQNYPNPFNSTTSISFSLKNETIVSLIIYDQLGRKVSELINNAHYKSGGYRIEFESNNLTSGIYFYNLQTSEFSETKKMILLK